MTSRQRDVRVTTCLVFVACLVLASTRVTAQQRSATELEIAGEQYRAGIEFARAERWADALAAFQRSYTLAPQPLALLNLAGAQVQTGHLVMGAQSYRRFLRDATSEPASRYRDAAAQTLRQTEARIAHVSVIRRDALSDDRAVLDGEALSSIALATPVPVDPGHHVILVLRGGTEIVQREINVVEGQSLTLDATTSAEQPLPTTPPHTVVPARETRATAPTPHPPPTRIRAQRPSVLASPWLWSAVGIAALGVAAALVYGFVSAPYEGNVPPGRVTAE